MTTRRNKGEIIFFILLLFILSLVVTQFVMAIKHSDVSVSRTVETTVNIDDR